MVEDDYRLSARRSLDRVQRPSGHIRDYFGDARALDLTADRLVAYATARSAAASHSPCEPLGCFTARLSP